MPDLSVVILSYNTRDLLEQSLQCLFAAGDEAEIGLEVIIIDNGSTDGTLHYLRSLGDRIILIENTQNVGFAAANNQGMALASHGVVLLLNSDAFIGGDTLRRGVELIAAQPRVGIVGVRLDNSDGTVQAECGTFPSLWDDIAVSLGLDQIARRNTPVPTTAAPVDWVQGACMFVRRAMVEAVGGLDTSFFMYSEEVEWCRRAWDGGWAVWYLPDAGVVHIGGGSSRNHDLGRRVALYTSRLSFRRRAGGPLSATILWLSILAGLGGRVVVRAVAEQIAGKRVGKQSPRGDWDLLRVIARRPPLASDRSAQIKPV